MPKRKRKKDDGSNNLANNVKYKGVVKSGKKFKAQIHIGGRTQGLGTFDTAKEAAEAFNLVATMEGRPTSKLKRSKKDDGSNNLANNDKYKGVVKSGKKFKAQIHIGGRTQGLGTFDTAKEAAEAFNLVATMEGRPTSKLKRKSKKDDGSKDKAGEKVVIEEEEEQEEEEQEEQEAEEIDQAALQAKLNVMIEEEKEKKKKKK